jgi:hypothetical protein
MDLDEHRRRFVASKLLDLRRAFEAGNEGALQEAARFCRDHGDGAVPPWVMDALIARHLDYMKQLPRGKGRYARWWTRFRQDQIDLARYDAMLEALERRAELGLVWTEGAADKRFYEAVAGVLKGTPAAGDWRDIKESYLRVKGRIETEPRRYKVLGVEAGT